MAISQIRLATKDDLRGEASAKTTVTGDAELGQAFQHGTLAARLVTDHNKLGKTDVFSNVAGEESVNFPQEGGIG